jgi:hypothetical protein
VPAGHQEVEDMKRATLTLVLFAVLALVPAAVCLAQAPAAATPAASPAPSLPSVEEFLETLASPTAALEKATLSTSPSCTVTGCPAGYKCCYPCGIPDCNWVCMAVKRCPLIP